jgi:hypothetical protein
VWIHLPSTCCPSAPASADSTSASEWRSQMLEQSASWRGKPFAAKSWLRAWEKSGWMMRLFGRIYEPSTAVRGAESWIASLAATRASHSASQGKGSGPTTQGTSGQMSPELSPNASHAPSSLRTSATIYEWASSKSTMTYAGWATALRRACLQRRKSALRTNENDSSSWPTPNVPNGGHSPKPGYISVTGKRANGSKKSVALEKRVKMWATPRASYGEKGGPNMSFGAGGVPLPTQACHFILTDQKTGTDGSMSSLCAPTYRPQLNPLFVEWLMGWPLGWTDCGDVATASSQQPLPSPGELCQAA